MFRLVQNRWFRRVAFGAVGALGLGAAMLPSAPAEARVYVGVGIPGYVAAPYYGYPYGYYPSYYGYPYSYGYPTGGVYLGFGGGGYHHHWH